ncbi:MAG: aminotransferase class IV [Clostridium sp.]
MECVNKYFIKNNEKKISSELNYSKDGEIIYEVLRVIDGVPLFLEEHYERMKNTFNKKSVELKFTLEECKESIYKLCKVNDVLVGNVKIIYPINEGNIYYFFIPHSYPTAEMYEKGVKTILYFGERNNPNEKIVNNSFRENVNKEIKENNAFEAILVDRDGYVTEGSRSNIFFIKGDELITSPVENVLPGVTRKNIIDVAKAEGVKIVEKRIHYKELKEYDVLFISGTSPKILPISEVLIEKFDINNRLLRCLMDSFNKKISNYIIFTKKTR